MGPEPEIDDLDEMHELYCNCDECVDELVNELEEDRAA